MKNFGASLLFFGIFCVSGTRAAETSAAAGSSQLILVSGASYTVSGPITRRGDSFEFRDAAGRLMTLDARQVREIRPPGESTRPAAPVVRRAQSSRPAAEPPVRYTNADLPAAARQAPEVEELEPEAAEPASDAASAPAPIEIDSPLVETLRIVDGHDESWWRRNAAERREEIVQLERKENELYRDIVCAQHGLAIGSVACNTLLRPKVNAEVPQTQAQRLRDARAQLEQRRQDLADFLARAFEVGVPTAWLLEKPKD